MSNSTKRNEIFERIGISILIGLGKFLVSTIGFILLFFVIFIILRPFIVKVFLDYTLLAISIVFIIPSIIGGVIGIRDGIRSYNHIAAQEIRQEYIKRISVYAKSAIISLVAGTLSSSFFGILVFATDGFSIDDFLWVLPRSILIGGFPSVVVALIVLAFFKNARNNENSIKLTYLITGLVVGALSAPFYAFGNF